MEVISYNEMKVISYNEMKVKLNIGAPLKEDNCKNNS
jgi:hypothetical protein